MICYLKIPLHSHGWVCHLTLKHISRRWHENQFSWVIQHHNGFFLVPIIMALANSIFLCLWCWQLFEHLEKMENMVDANEN